MTLKVPLAALALGTALTFCAAAEPARVVGVGLVIKIENRYPVVDSLVAGGPAAREGTLKPGDRIEGVAQGEGPWEETAGLKLAEVVDKIRGARGTTVRLRVIRFDEDGTGARQQVSVRLKRDILKEPPARSK
jgi:carboxyl-terminal processing protease